MKKENSCDEKEDLRNEAWDTRDNKDNSSNHLLQDGQSPSHSRQVMLYTSLVTLLGILLTWKAAKSCQIS